MSRLPTLSAKRLIKILTGIGFRKIRQEGSHIFFAHTDGRVTVVPFHAAHDVGRGLLRKIIEDIHMTPKEFQKHL